MMVGVGDFLILFALLRYLWSDICISQRRIS